jgi:hypothetical protein
MTITSQTKNKKTSTRLLARNLLHGFLPDFQISSPIESRNGFQLYTAAPTGPKTNRGQRCILTLQQPTKSHMVSIPPCGTELSKNSMQLVLLTCTRHKCQQVRPNSLPPIHQDNHTRISCRHLQTQCRSVLSSSPSRHP